MNETSKGLHLNRDRGMLFGVCAGLADYFGIQVLFVRIAVVIATLTWPPTILVYLALFFCLNDKPGALSNSRVCRHLKAVDYRKRLYKNQRNKKIAGVCAGLADYFETSPLWIRLAFLLALFFFLGPIAIFIYILAALIMDKEPAEVAYARQQGKRVDDPVSEAARARPMGKRDIQACSDKFANLEKKLRRLEATITSKKFKLHSELNRI